MGLYKELLEDPANIKILVYSGDDDGVCGTVGTQEWIWDLGFEVAFHGEINSFNTTVINVILLLRLRLRVMSGKFILWTSS